LYFSGNIILFLIKIYLCKNCCRNLLQEQYGVPELIFIKPRGSQGYFFFLLKIPLGSKLSLNLCLGS